MGAPMSGQGTVFKRNGAPIAEVVSIGGPNMSRETIDITSLDVLDGYRKFIASFRDAGTIDLNMNFTNETYKLMKADFESDEPQEYQIVLPDEEASTLSFEGLVTELPLNVPTGDKITVDVTIKISGAVTFTDTSSPS